MATKKPKQKKVPAIKPAVKKKPGKKGGKQPGAGRPESKITGAELKKLASYGMTREEMADFIGISRITLYNHIKKDPDLELAIAQGMGSMAMSVRRKQIQLAKKGNSVMLVWVGKQYLGQKDKLETVESMLPPQLEALLSTMTKEELFKIAGIQPTGSKPVDTAAAGGSKTNTGKKP